MTLSGGEEEGDFDDFPETHLDEDDYEEFLAREFDAQGQHRPDGPPITTWLLTLIGVILLVIAILFL